MKDFSLKAQHKSCAKFENSDYSIDSNEVYHII